MKKRNDPIAIIFGGLEALVTWVPLLIVVSGVCFVGMVTFAVLWFVR